MRYERDDILVPITNRKDMMYQGTGLKYLKKVSLMYYINDESSSSTLAMVQILEEPTGNVYAAADGTVTTMAKKDMSLYYTLGDSVVVDTKYFLPAISQIEFGPRHIDWRIKLIMISKAKITND
jgi:hypothetical protein